MGTFRFLYCKRNLHFLSFKDFKELLSQIGRTFLVNTFKEKSIWNAIKIIKVEKGIDLSKERQKKLYAIQKRL